MNTPPFTQAAVQWQGRASYRSLEIGWSGGDAFVALWHHWRQDRAAPLQWHHVVICEQAPELGPLLQRVDTDPLLCGESATLQRQWFALEPGVHELRLSGGRIRLILCIGPALPMLRERAFLADSLLVHDPRTDRWLAKALARLAAQNAPLRTGGAPHDPAEPADPALQAVGFACVASHPDGSVDWRYRPQHPPAIRRAPWRQADARSSRCIVIGAGLAGAGVAAAWAERGCSVQVLERSAAAGAGASGLPAGLLVPSGGLDPGPRRLLLRAGARLTLQRCHELLQAGRDWAPTGVLQFQPVPSSATSAVDDAWSQKPYWPATPSAWMTGRPPIDARWHAHAAWIRPGRLVAALLDQAGVATRYGCDVARVRRQHGLWQALDSSDRVLAEGEHLVLANAIQAAALAGPLLLTAGRAGPDLGALLPVAGQISWGLHDPGPDGHWPPHPVNGLGSFIAGVPLDEGSAWFAGATYEQVAVADSVALAHAANRERLAQLLPQIARQLDPAFESGRVRAWRGERCTSPDRLPLCGRLADGELPGLWISTAMGSRGLTLALLCGELIAAQACGDPLPVSSRAARLLRPERLVQAC